MSEEKFLLPIADIRTDFSDKFGIPRQSGRAPALEATIVFRPAYRDPDALRCIHEFSHLWLIFGFSANPEASASFPTVRPPRLGGNKRVGVFASRSPYRPNGLGLSCVRLLRTECSTQGTVLIVAGADLLDRTPIYDIKPYLPYCDSHPEARGGYADALTSHTLSVEIPHSLLKKIPEEKQKALRECLADDPRPAYQNDDERIYRMTFADKTICFCVSGDRLTVLDVEEQERSPRE